MMTRRRGLLSVPAALLPNSSSNAKWEKIHIPRWKWELRAAPGEASCPRTSPSSFSHQKRDGRGASRVSLHCQRPSYHSPRYSAALEWLKKTPNPNASKKKKERKRDFFFFFLAAG